MFHSLVISLPIVICLFWAVFFLIRLFRHNEERRVTGSLVCFFGVATVLYFDHWLYFSGVICLAGEWSYGIANLCVYPLYYAYLRALTRVQRSIEVPLLLLPALVAVVLFPIARFGGLISDRTLFYVIRICFSVQIVWVLFRGWQLLLNTIRRMDDTYSDYRSRLLRPTHISLVIFGMTSVVSMTLNFFGRDFFAHDASVELPASVMTILLYGLGFVAAHTVVPPEAVAEEMHADDAPQVEENALIHRIDDVMREKALFRNPQLTIHDLAREVNSNRTYVSSAINRQYKVNFSTYVNRIRIEEAKRILADASYSHDKEAIADAIALSGFQTDQTFYRVFKEFTGTTPLLYRRST